MKRAPSDRSARRAASASGQPSAGKQSGPDAELPRRAVLARVSSGRADHAVIQFSPLAMASATRMPSTAAETIPPA